jgi:aspartate/methionine/tyrosine aminotransferase
MEGIPLIADEVYNDSLRVSGNSRPAHTLGEHCVSINSLTKIYALGSLRFGWIIASEEVANNAMRALMTFTGMLATPSARLAAAAWPHLQKALDAIEERRKHAIPLLEKLLEKHGIDWQAPPQGVFGAFDIGVDAMQAIDGIGKQEGLLAIPGCMFHKDLKTWMRVAWSKSPEDFAEDIQALDRVLTRIQS